MTSMENITEVTEFILLGLTDDPNLQVPLLLIFLFIYLVTLIGNGGMMVIIFSDSHLHTPMYFFLSNLSFVDLGYSSAVAPKMVAALQSGNKVISYNGCAAQFFFFVGFATVECYLLASMAYDRHAAVCRPLHYTTTMTTGVCTILTIGSYTCGFLNASIHAADTFKLSFCGSNKINHFFCDIPPLLALACSSTHISKLVVFFVVGFNVFFTLLVIIISYFFIYIAIQNMKSSEGRKKAFSTCASHLTAVSIFYGTIIFMYLQPSSGQSMDTDKIASVFYTVVIPMLNPLIYSLRNREVKSALWKILNRFYPASFSVSRK
ncbi:olfactory receptor 5B21 [Mus musculus]|jgi:olfactory receptor|uniref:Olfactory receptor 5B21 n=2 Tax=Mus musculus TaxID=10090 RepID=O5B21_MOUSE|nr:olfactory receptor 5B21 [Mus musculus]Q8VFX2.1 RecName: Full=Olfactory receptor 5B21; AltName: Full=Olfactory receptor 1444; AltName: Full=Olfactory receptor 202-4 [Mus musculus]AAI19060.1 Olfactory receptor 1444 [Mus musculus]AAI25620.1 Olfactory receptor 1444 [Mus musculus]AAL61056.1 olfactory receptor MOR202-4 [Mus musculus]AAP71814.1 olfactory receptor Olfr1444 [Mus musculus]EDL41489.1 olfactory receptor 1444 [Mus musculus]|eukprot:NP_666913.1 olfactory receptor 1444 [Mus musculus]